MLVEPVIENSNAIELFWGELFALGVHRLASEYASSEMLV